MRCGLVVLLILSRWLWGVTAAASLRKCCDQGESLSGFECVQSTHYWSYAEITLGCLLDANCEPAFADRGNTVSCIDNQFGSDTVVGFLCSGPHNTTFQVPDVHYLRKCCPLERSYDSRIQSCWGDIPDVKPSAFLNVIMYNAGSDGVIDVETGPPDCGPDRVVVDHYLPSGDVRRLQSSSIRFRENGRDYIFNPQEVCVDKTEESDILVVRSCEEANIACERHTCIRKCCPEGKSFFNRNNCSYVNREPIEPVLVVHSTADGFEPMELRPPAYWFGGMECEKYLEAPSRKYTLDPDGNIYYTVEDTVTEAGVFCVEHAYHEGVFDEYVFICFPDFEPKPEVHIWTTLGMIVSSFFLLLTFLVYAALPSLKNLHGKTLMCHVLSLLVAYVTLSTVQLITDQLLHTLCVFLGYITVFSFLASFFWLNVISFDIWWTFGSMRPVMDRKRRECRRFLLYSAYAWLSPSLITAAVLSAQEGDWLPRTFQPGIGTESCWFAPTTKAVFVFFIGPIGLLLTANLVFFLLTARHCSRVKSDLDRVGHTPIADRKFKSDKSRLIMNCKLFVAMGINWGLESLSSVSLYVDAIPHQVWYIFDMANACQGLVIFVIFVCKKRVLVELRKKVTGLFYFRGRPPPRQPSVSTLFSGNTATTNSTATGQDVCIHLMKKSVSESRLSPLPPQRGCHKNLHVKSRSTNRLLR